METGQVPSLAEVADRMAIHDVLNLHCRGVDRADEATLKSAYWPDAEVAYGAFNGNAHEFCHFLPRAIRSFVRTQHAISNVTIDLRGDEARVETYVKAYHYVAGEAGAADTEMIYLGRYLDRMAKRDGVWKMIHRRVLMDWNQNVAASAVFEGPPFDGLVRGDRYPLDPVYDHLK
ncbi:MAG: nuclear transport factor 2 family protein [Gammaproteobacteria bacterium]|nr:nuclear transport factor 2 family protein [Gammaproteobacteria bacterium]